MSKTIKQLADEIGISKQALQKRISREPLYTTLQPYISTKQGTKYIDDDGAKLVFASYSKKQPTTKTENVHRQPEPATSIDIQALYIHLTGQLEAKDRQIQAQQQTIQELTESNRNLTAALTAAQALHAGTMQKQLPKKGGIFSRIFNKGKER